MIHTKQHVNDSKNAKMVVCQHKIGVAKIKYWAFIPVYSNYLPTFATSYENQGNY